MITRVKVVSVDVTDQAAARRCYTEALGFEVRHEAPMAPGVTWLEGGATWRADGGRAVNSPTRTGTSSC